MKTLQQTLDLVHGLLLENGTQHTALKQLVLYALGDLHEEEDIIKEDQQN